MKTDDAVSLPDTHQFCTSLLASVGGGTFTGVLGPPKNEIPSNVKYNGTYVASAYGDDEAFSAQIYREVGAALDTGVFKPNKVRVVPGGLAGVEGALKELEAGKVSAEKLVYVIADTPGV